MGASLRTPDPLSLPKVDLPDVRTLSRTFFSGSTASTERSLVPRKSPADNRVVIRPKPVEILPQYLFNFILPKPTQSCRRSVLMITNPPGLAHFKKRLVAAL